MQTEFKIQDNIGIVNFTGDLNLICVDEVRQKFKDWDSANPGLLYVVVDLKEVSLVDSAGLGVLIAMYKQVEARGGELVLCNLNKKVRMVFELTRVHQIFSIYDNVDEAVRART